MEAVSITRPRNSRRALLLAAAASAALPLSAAASAVVDFRYAPPEWQTAICLPDDPHKSLVDRSGELLYHHNQGGRGTT